MRLTDARVLLTGASGGLGAAIAEELAGAGARLVLTARRRELVEALAVRVGGEAVRADLADPDAIPALADAAGAVDVVVHNAALPASGAFHSFTPEQLDRALDVNLRAPLQLSRLLVDGMLERGRGHHAFVASMSAKVATAGSSVYSATKFGLRGAALGMRDDWRPHGVSASVVCPGFVRDAGMFHDAAVDLPAYVATVTPDAVARAVRRAIEEDRAELAVAPVGLRASGVLFAAAPELVRRAGARLGGRRVAADMARGQTHLR